MSNPIPFIMSSSPPPIDDCDEEEDDEFGDFRVADISYSLTDLNQGSDLLENGKSWLEPTTKTKENEFQSFHLSISNSLPNETSSSIICSNEEDSQLKPIKSCSEPNGIPSDLTDSFPSESENLQNRDSDFLLQCIDMKNVSSGQNKINNPEDTYSGTALKKEVQQSPCSLGIEFSSTGWNETEETDRTKKLKSVDSNKKEPDINSDDFSDFTDFTNGSDLSNFQNTTTNHQEPVLNVIDSQDEFDDFDDFESAEFKAYPIKEPSFEETLKMMFENPKKGKECSTDMAEITDSLHLCLDDSSSVWGHLKELETSHALSYQWSSSTANKTLLSSLNIDCRNIIFGARWNVCVPRFAANLGVNPLEPVKAAETPSFTPVNSAPSTSSVEDVVPAAQFDWTSSGLTNPLDGLEKENASSTAETTVPDILEGSEVETVKQVVNDIFGSFSDEVVKNETEEESMILPSPISSDPDLRQKKMSAEAYMVVESFPDLSFLSARKLMHAADENMSRWRVKP